MLKYMWWYVFKYNFNLKKKKQIHGSWMYCVKEEEFIQILLDYNSNGS